LLPALERANKQRVEAGLSAIAHVTNHTLRRTFASLLYEAGAQPPQVTDQLGHTSAALALEVYARKMERSRDTGKRMDALLDLAQTAQRLQLRCRSRKRKRPPSSLFSMGGAGLEPATPCL
jgi:hypothetical protein